MEQSATVLVLGAYGLAGRAIVTRLLDKTPFYVIAAGRDRARLQSLFGTFSPEGEGNRGTAILVSDRPEGPFVPHSQVPVTPPDWMALDGTLFIDEEEHPWMVFCHEWVQIVDGAICAIRLSEDLSRAEGSPVTLFHASEAPWIKDAVFGDNKGLITDGPWLHRNKDGSLLMLWSSFGGNRQYTTGSARSASGKITGPWVVSPAILYGQDGGHAMLFKTLGGATGAVSPPAERQTQGAGPLF